MVDWPQGYMRYDQDDYTMSEIDNNDFFKQKSTFEIKQMTQDSLQIITTELVKIRGRNKMGYSKWQIAKIKAELENLDKQFDLFTEDDELQTYRNSAPQEVTITRLPSGKPNIWQILRAYFWVMVYNVKYFSKKGEK